MRIVVYHSYYGCDTGCCGHVIEVDGERVGFEFIHPYNESIEGARRYAEELVRREVGADHVADLDWEHCDIQLD